MIDKKPFVKLIVSANFFSILSLSNLTFTKSFLMLRTRPSPKALCLTLIPFFTRFKSTFGMFFLVLWLEFIFSKYELEGAYPIGTVFVTDALELEIGLVFEMDFEFSIGISVICLAGVVYTCVIFPRYSTECEYSLYDLVL